MHIILMRIDSYKAFSAHWCFYGSSYPESNSMFNLYSIQYILYLYMHTPSGEEVTKKSFMDYVGTLLSVDGCILAELGRRIGCANVDFNLLRRVGHSTLSTKREVALFTSLLASKLLYGLSYTCLAVAHRLKAEGLLVFRRAAWDASCEDTIALLFPSLEQNSAANIQ